MIFISLKLGLKKNLTIKNCDFIYLTLLLLHLGWYIMGCEPKPFPYYRELSNCTYKNKFKLHFTLGYSFSRPMS